ncbi:MAG: ABC transporter substrate-binding protein [Anaerolineaceae bacterium]|nr:ABC transporter substrate-binding protein [Anaerolineaceae bacterium]
MRWKVIPLVLCLSIVFLSGCQSDPEMAESPELLAMTFMAGYKPQANLPFVGVYVAQEKGFFAEQGLDVTFEHSSGQGQHLQLLAAGEIQVTTQDAAVLLMRRLDPGLPLVSIALLGQRGQQAFAALTTSGLQTPLDWEGRLVGYKGTPPPDLYALISAAGADLEKIELVNVGFDPRLLTEGKVDVYPVYKSNEPYMIRSWGYDLVLWDAADYGVPTLGLTYVTSDEILEQDPEMLVRFLRAAMKGIEFAMEHRDEAVDIVLMYTGPETDPEHMRFMLDAELIDLESDLTDLQGLGWQTAEQWQALADMLYTYGVLEDTSIAGEVFTTEILEGAQNE